MADPRISIGGDASGLEKAVNIAKGKLGEFEAALPAKGIAAFSSAASALGATLSAGAFIAAMRNTVYNLDQLEEAAQSAGTSVRELSALRYAGSFSGLDDGTIQKALELLSSKLLDAKKGSEEAAAAFNALGLKSLYAGKQVASSDKALEAIADRFASYRDGAEKSALAADIFGQKFGPRLVPFLNQGAAGIQRLKEEAEALGLVIGDKQASDASKLADNLDRLGKLSQGAAIAVAKDLVPALNTFIDRVLVGKREVGEFGAAVAAAFKRGDNVRTVSQITGELADMQAELERIDRLGLPGKLFGPDSFKAALLPGRIKQLRAELALAQKDTKDFVNEAARLESLFNEGGDRRPTAPLAAKAKPQQLGNYGPEFEDLKRIRANRAKMAEEIDQEEQKAADKNAEIAQRYIEHWTLAVNARVDAVRQSVMSEKELEDEKFLNAQDALRAKLELDVTFQEEFRRLSEDLERQHQENLTDIEDRESMRRYGIAQVYRKLDIDSTRAFLGQVSVLMNANSRKQFEIGKAAAIGSAAIDAIKAANGAYAALASIPYAGPYLGAVAAAAALAAGFANVQRIKATQFGGGAGGGGAAFAAIQSSGDGFSPSTGDPTATIGRAEQAPRRIEVIFEDESQSLTAAQIRELIEQINEQGDYGAEITIRRG